MTELKAACAGVALAVVLATTAMAAQEANPTGTWKWSTERNGQKIESVLKLKLEGDKLSGTISGRDGKDSAVEEPTFKDGEVKFQVTRDRNGEKIVIKYSGKVSGDTITGTSGAGDRTREWKAERAKE